MKSLTSRVAFTIIHILTILVALGSRMPTWQAMQLICLACIGVTLCEYVYGRKVTTK